MVVFEELLDSDEAAIANMNADWTSKWYPLGKNNNLSVNLKWDDVSPTGNLYFEYSNVSISDIARGADPMEEEKNNLVLDGSFQSQMILDENLAVQSYRLRFVRTGGAANIVGFRAVNKNPGA